MNEAILKLLQGEDRFYPHELEKQYPHILNKIVELWDTPQMEAYFVDLMVDKRGTRKGFPQDVATEIYYLDQIYERLRSTSTATDINPWATVDIRKQHEQDFLKLVETNDVASIRLLLNSGIDVDIRDERGWTPLMISAFNGNEETAALLIRSGADVHAADLNGYRPLHWAAFNGYFKVVKLLLEKQADPNAQSSHGWTPLIQAATRGHPIVVKQLIEGGAQVNLASKDGWTALHKSTANGHTEIVKMLLCMGADPAIKYQDGSTALSIATKNKREVIIALLKAMG